jgi:hypothetical protein
MLAFATGMHSSPALKGMGIPAKFIESRGDNTPEDSAERENYWLADIISPERLARYQEYPAYEGHSKEWIIMDALLAKLVEQGAEMDQQARARLRNLVSAFRVLMIPNLTQDEQAFMGDLAKATTVNWSALRTEITPDTISDVRWMWGTFRLKRPTNPDGQAFLGFPGRQLPPGKPQIRPR